MKKKKKKTPFLDFYNKCIESGVMPNSGLCCNFEPKEVELLDEYFAPIYGDDNGNHYGLYWGSYINPLREGETGLYHPHQVFNIFRQNVVLLCAAMTGEL